ncbi:MAG: hypothetical protein IBX64_06725 [Actinobacteria bacterium]|nr:hypothetical protein [Actinomycetota bacterium]
MKLHNVNVDVIRETIDRGKDEASTIRFPLNVSGRWQAEEGKPQFTGKKNHLRNVSPSCFWQDRQI